MSKLKIFVSSTCYDLNTERTELNKFINSFGYEPVMSDFSDVPYDPRLHTHESCVKEVENCDMIICIVSSRFGGKAVPSALKLIDFEKIKSKSKIEPYRNTSITQLEILRGIQLDIPIYTFIDSKVYNDHNSYEKNKKNKKIISGFNFPSIEKKETAKYIFEFINFIKGLSKNNNIQTFYTLDDITNHLKKQWSGLFQRIIYEHRINLIKEKSNNLKGLKKVNIDIPDNSMFEDLQYSTSIKLLSNTSKTFFKQNGDNVKEAVKNGCNVKIALSNPRSLFLRDEYIREGLCKDSNIIGEIYEVLKQINDIILELKKISPPLRKGSIKVKTFFSVPTGSIIILNDKIIRYTPYLAFYESPSAPKFDIHNEEECKLFETYHNAFGRVWKNSKCMICIDFTSTKEFINPQLTEFLDTFKPTDVYFPTNS